MTGLHNKYLDVVGVSVMALQEPQHRISGSIVLCLVAGWHFGDVTQG